MIFQKNKARVYAFVVGNAVLMLVTALWANESVKGVKRYTGV